MKMQLFRQMRERYERFQKGRAAFDPGARSWYRIENKTADMAEVYIYDGIGVFGVEAEQFVRDFDAIEASQVTLRINSPGGDVFDGMAIYNAIKRHNATVTTEIDGVAASMASLIALAGDNVNMHEFGLFMIHEPFSLVMGTADDMRAEADLLDKIADQGVDIYRAASNLDETEIRAAMSAETWYTAVEAKEAGFVHNVIAAEEDKPAAALTFDLSMFDNAPSEHCKPGPERDAEVTRRSIERTLRDAGMSRRDIRALIAGGLNPDSGRDAASDDVLCHQLNTLIHKFGGN